MRLFRSFRITRNSVICACTLSLLFSVLIMCVTQRAVEASATVKDGSVAVPIIMYHSILKDSSRAGQYVISPSLLESDLKWLKANGFTAVLPTDLYNFVEYGTPLPEKPILLSFDDGYYNNYLYAFPLLEKYDMKMLLAVIGIYSDRFSETNENNAYYSHCTWTQLSEMLASGRVELANHTYNLHTYDSVRHGCSKNSWESLIPYRNMLYEDVLRLQNTAREKANCTPITFVYPFGSYCKETVQFIREMGFACSLSCESGINYITRDRGSLYEMKRFLRPSGSSSKQYFEKILSPIMSS